MLVLYVCACTVVVGCLLQYLNQFKEVDQVVMKYALGDACVRVATNKVRTSMCAHVVQCTCTCKLTVQLHVHVYIHLLILVYNYTYIYTFAPS